MSTTPKAYIYIRFSTPGQDEGNSEDRQLEMAEEFCKKHGLIFDRNNIIEDSGLSGFSGAHVKKGELGKFLDQVKEGRIEQGSYLVVENLDRLSREMPLTAMSQLATLANKGIKVGVAKDNTIFSEEVGSGELFKSLAQMVVVHEESEKKSDRSKDNWERKRKELYNEGKKLTRRVPAWIKVVESNGEIDYELKPDMCKAIESIFSKKLEGKGSHRITIELNSEKNVHKLRPITKINKSGGWRKSYIAKILRDRNIIGEFQPYKLTKTGREPVIKREYIKNYYPKAIDEDLFWEVQSILDNNKQRPGRGGVLSLIKYEEIKE